MVSKSETGKIETEISDDVKWTGAAWVEVHTSQRLQNGQGQLGLIQITEVAER